jgi:hypothetical protein
VEVVAVFSLVPVVELVGLVAVELVATTLQIPIMAPQIPVAEAEAALPHAMVD